VLLLTGIRTATGCFVWLVAFGTPFVVHILEKKRIHLHHDQSLQIFVPILGLSFFLFFSLSLLFYSLSLFLIALACPMPRPGGAVIPGMIPILHPPHLMIPGQFRDVLLRNTFGDANEERDFRFNGVHNGGGLEWRRDVNDRSIGLDGTNGLLGILKDGQTEVLLSAFWGVTQPTILLSLCGFLIDHLSTICRFPCAHCLIAAM
jgi:hypothetical protein